MMPRRPVLTSTAGTQAPSEILLNNNYQSKSRDNIVMGAFSDLDPSLETRRDLTTSRNLAHSGTLSGRSSLYGISRYAACLMLFCLMQYLKPSPAF